MWSVEDLDTGIFDLQTAPMELVDQLSEAKMRFAIYNTIPEGSNMNICILPTTIITIQPRHQVFINNIMDDPRVRWILRGVASGVETFVNRRNEITRFTFYPIGEKANTRRKVYLFVRVYPPHFVELGTSSDTGELSVRIKQSTDVFGDLAELCIAAGEDHDEVA
jgi:hypothetical protein